MAKGVLMIKYPIFILSLDSGDIDVYSSFEEMEKELEQIDVENGEFAAWDNTGRIVILGVQRPTWLELKTGEIDKKGLVKAVRHFADLEKATLEINPEELVTAIRMIKSKRKSFLRKIIEWNWDRF